MGKRITIDQASYDDVAALLGFLAPRARQALAPKGAGHAAWDAVREAEAVVGGHGLKHDRGDRFVCPSLDMPHKVDRLRMVARVLSRHAA